MGRALLNLQYQYDAGGNITQRHDKSIMRLTNKKPSPLTSR
jgi:hypothetical protein